jgi:hypothetical protein
LSAVPQLEVRSEEPKGAHDDSGRQSPEFEERLVSVGFPSPKTADVTILGLRAIEPPL